MLHTPSFGRAVPRPVPQTATALGPLTPQAYLALRRRAARLSVDDAASLIVENTTSPRFMPRSERLAEARALIRQLETPGILARHVTTVDLLAAAFPLDPNVYYQLAHEPADRHPAVCRGCGCSQWDACDRGADGACAWASSDLCTRCSGGDRL